MHSLAKLTFLVFAILFTSTNALALSQEPDLSSPVVGNSTIQNDQVRQQEAISAQVKQWGQRAKLDLTRIQRRLDFLKSHKVPLNNDIYASIQQLKSLADQAQHGSVNFDFYQALDTEQEIEDLLASAEQVLEVPQNIQKAKEETAKLKKSLASNRMKADYYQNDLTDIFSSWQSGLGEMQSICNQSDYFYSNGQSSKASALILIDFKKLLELAQEKEELSIWAYNRNNTSLYIDQHINNMRARMDYAKAKGKNTATLEEYFDNANQTGREIVGLIGIFKSNQGQINQKLYQFQALKNGFYKELGFLPDIYKQATTIKYLSPPESFCLIDGVQMPGSCNEWKMKQDNKKIIVPPARSIPNTPTTPFSAPLSLIKQFAATITNYLSNLMK